MKTLSLISIALPALALAISCAQDGVDPPGGTAGQANTGGASGGGGSPTAGGGAGVAGTLSTSGSAGVANGGTAGVTSLGGSGGGGAGGMSTGGSAGSGGGAPALTPDSFAGIKNQFQESWVNSFILMPCYGQAEQDCITNAPGTSCPNQNGSLPMEQQGRVTHEYFTVGGDAGKNYKVTIHVTGISEAKYYVKGMRAAGNGDPPNANDPNGIDTFYTGGEPVNVENYNIYKITVRNPPAPGAMPETGTEVQHYYLNSFPQTNTPYEDHESFPLNYTHDIVVPGTGVIEYLTADRNCHAIDNCGQGFHGTSCSLQDGRKVPSDPNLTVPSSYMGTPVSTLNSLTGASQPYHSQILHIVVTNVVAM